MRNFNSLVKAKRHPTLHPKPGLLIEHYSIVGIVSLSFAGAICQIY